MSTMGVSVVNPILFKSYLTLWPDDWQKTDKFHKLLEGHYVMRKSSCSHLSLFKTVPTPLISKFHSLG